MHQQVFSHLRKRAFEVYELSQTTLMVYQIAVIHSLQFVYETYTATAGISKHWRDTSTVCYMYYHSHSTTVLLLRKAKKAKVRQILLLQNIYKRI